ncbi:mirror-image polydactyly gene 1 protein isoform X1 [Erpetoichthys calabaricus]|uniref:Mirror-image polydactyly 1 n=2 Tax=Erpetoichthys calabaricus TaxID=27687 RepID=A0A8C4SZK3_ERPCA|nr:mirror-image polydactyly gene 1 protein isoform X1 [Erpetoichthys calabaricus]
MNAADKLQQVRAALRRVKQRMSGPRDQLDDTDVTTDDEVESRSSKQKHNKKQQETLIDMYQANPKVNEELRDRLPATKKHDYKDKAKQSLEPESSSELLQPSCRPVPEQTSCGAQMDSFLTEPNDLDQYEKNRNQQPSEERERLSDRSEKLHPIKMNQDIPKLERSSRVKGNTEENANDQWGALSCERQGNSLVSASLTSANASTLLDKDKNIAFLLKELDALREINRKLQDKLSEKDQDLERWKMDAELQEKMMEAKTAEKAAALVEEIYQAQRERDQAMMARLRLANEERDEALLQAKRLEQAIMELENINPEENDTALQELLNQIQNADSGLTIEKSGAVIVDRILKTKERKKKITAEEMNAVIEEREAALTRCKRLEQELHQVKERSQTSANNMRHLTAENNQERALKAQLQYVQQEKENAVKQCKKLEDEVQTLQVYYGLHQSLSQEAAMKEHLNCTLSSYEEALRSRNGIVTLANLQKEQLVAQLQLALSDRIKLEAQLRETATAHKDANEKIHKLERLVDVLRKKVGAGAVRTVI